MSRPVPAEVVTAAQASQRRHGCPASVCVAQWAQESGWGEHYSGKNDPCGSKATVLQAATVRTTREFTGGRWVTIKARFRDFASLADAFDAHGKLLATGSAYGEARKHLGDPKAYARALTGHYATDPNYGTALIAIMDGGGFYAFDTLPTEAPAVVSQSSPSMTIKPAWFSWAGLKAFFGLAGSTANG